jgi:hypothetical protein
MKETVPDITKTDFIDNRLDTLDSDYLKTNESDSDS